MQSNKYRIYTSRLSGRQCAAYQKHTNEKFEDENSVHSCVITSLLLPSYLFTVNTLVSIILFPRSLLCGVTPWQRIARGEFHSSCWSLCPHVETVVDEHTHKQVPVHFHKQNHKSNFHFYPYPLHPKAKILFFLSLHHNGVFLKPWQDQEIANEMKSVIYAPVNIANFGSSYRLILWLYHPRFPTPIYLFHLILFLGIRLSPRLANHFHCLGLDLFKVLLCSPGCESFLTGRSSMLEGMAKKACIVWPGVYGGVGERGSERGGEREKGKGREEKTDDWEQPARQMWHICLCCMLLFRHQPGGWSSIMMNRDGSTEGPVAAWGCSHQSWVKGGETSSGCEPTQSQDRKRTLGALVYLFLPICCILRNATVSQLNEA